MKKLYMRLAALMFAAVLMFTGAGKISAADQQCSLTVRLADLETVSGGVGVTVYQVGKLKSQDNLQIFLPVTGLEDMSAALTADNLNRADFARKTAIELSNSVESRGISGRTVNTDAAGSAVFTGLDPGIYLVRQTSGETEYGVIQPFLAVLPYVEVSTGELLYQMEASPKAEAPEPPETETETETESETSETDTVKPEDNKPASGGPGTKVAQSPGTGDDTSLMLWVILLGLAAAGFIVAAAVKRNCGNK
ncbi:MAG: hypothetical protein Q4F83_14530 [Eubacteriales bacterium]|nr:hypothetical protein [Eubacteriales bacterium]